MKKIFMLALSAAALAPAQTVYTLASPADCSLSSYVCNNLQLAGGGTFHFNTPGVIGGGGFFAINALSPVLNGYTNPANSTRFKLVAIPSLTLPDGTSGPITIEYALSDQNHPGIFDNGKMDGQATVHHRCGIRGCITWLSIDSATLTVDQSTVAILD